MVEADINKVDQAKVTQQMMADGMYAGGDTLEKHLKPATFKALSDYCKANGLPMESANAMKPGVAAMVVESLLLGQMGLSPDSGIDKHFLDAAGKDTGKKIVEFESVEMQMKLIFGLDDAAADKMLAETFKDDSKDEIEKMLKAWQAGGCQRRWRRKWRRMIKMPTGGSSMTC